ncbi:hypothetical protein HKBW3S43_01426, partial [Candidatus Hakubella thermalkaliphila]
MRFYSTSEFRNENIASASSYLFSHRSLTILSPPGVKDVAAAITFLIPIPHIFIIIAMMGPSPVNYENIKHFLSNTGYVSLPHQLNTFIGIG